MRENLPGPPTSYIVCIIEGMRGDDIEAIRAIANDSWGLLTARQAEARGISRLQLARLVDRDQLVRVARGVYGLLGAVPTSHLKTLSAWLALTASDSDEVVVAGVAAAAWHGLSDGDPDLVDLIVPARRITRRNGVRIRVRVLAVDEFDTLNGLPVLSIERTVADLVEMWADDELIVEAYRRACDNPTFDVDALDRHLAPLAAARGLPDSDGAYLRAQLLEPPLSTTRKATFLMTNPTRDLVDDVVQRIAMTALGYYAQIQIDDPEYRLSNEARWCLEPLDGVEVGDRSALERLASETIVDPTAHREQLFEALLTLLP